MSLADSHGSQRFSLCPMYGILCLDRSTDIPVSSVFLIDRKRISFF